MEKVRQGPHDYGGGWQDLNALENQTYADNEWMSPSAGLDHYLEQIGQYSLLTAEQEVELAKQIEAGRLAEEELERQSESNGSATNHTELQNLIAAGRAAKERFFLSNLRLVVSIAKKYNKTVGYTSFSFDDLVSEGNIGLRRAVEKFDYSQGYKFSTYATNWIRSIMHRAIQNKDRMIRLPVYVYEEKSHTLLQGANGHKIKEAKAQTKYVESLNNTLSRDTKDEVGDFVPGSDSVDDTVLSKVMREQASKTIAETAAKLLSLRERRVIKMRFGLDGSPPRSYPKIGRELGLTHQRIQQIEQEAFAKLANSDDGLSRDMLSYFD